MNKKDKNLTLADINEIINNIEKNVKNKNYKYIQKIYCFKKQYTENNLDYLYFWRTKGNLSN